MSETSYEIFISYRREGGEALAHLLYERLTNEGYNVFLDVEVLRSGKFNEALYQKIEECNYFLLLLPPNGLDRCISEDDWVRLEIEHALQFNKRIIPLMMRNFQFPKNLPDSLRELPHYNGINADMELFDGVIIRLKKMICSKKHTKSIQQSNEKMEKLHKISKSFTPRTIPITDFTENENVDIIIYETVNKVIIEKITENDFNIVANKIYLTEHGVEKLESVLNIDDLSADQAKEVYDAVIKILYARYCMDKKRKDYACDRAVSLYICPYSGSGMNSRWRFADGLFQALQLKEDFPVSVFDIEAMKKCNETDRKLVEAEDKMKISYLKLMEMPDTTGYYMYKAGQFYCRDGRFDALEGEWVDLYVREGEKGVQTAKSLFESASYAGNKRAKWMLFRYYDHYRRDYLSSKIILKELADDGDIYACQKLGRRYVDGTLIAKDIVQGIQWFLKAAELGDELSYLHLGDLYIDGKEIKRDCEKAIMWYRKAAELDNRYAQYKLGEIYAEKGEFYDVEKSLYWYRRAADNCSQNAALKLGMMYEMGLDIEQNYIVSAH